MATLVKPLDPTEATLEIDPEISAVFGKGAARTRQIEGFACHPGRQSHRTSFVIYLNRGGLREVQKHPIAIRLSSRDARRLGRMFAQMADMAEGIG